MSHAEVIPDVYGMHVVLGAQDDTVQHPTSSPKLLLSSVKQVPVGQKTADNQLKTFDRRNYGLTVSTLVAVHPPLEELVARHATEEFVQSHADSRVCCWFDTRQTRRRGD